MCMGECECAYVCMGVSVSVCGWGGGRRGEYGWMGMIYIIHSTLLSGVDE